MSFLSRIQSWLGLDSDAPATRAWGANRSGEDALGWGNGFQAEWTRTQGSTPDGTGGFGESMSDMGRSLSRSGVGTNERYGASGGRYDRTYDDWGFGGLGFGGSTDTLFGTEGAGFGVGGGGGHWTADSGNGRTSEGYGGGVGVNARSDQNVDVFGEHLGAGGELYRGVGGNAYAFEEPGASGYGIDGTYTPFGVNNAYADYDGVLGSGGIQVENGVYGQSTGSLEAGVRDDGTVFSRASVAPSRMELNNVDAHYDSALGHTEAHLGTIGKGGTYQANTYFNPETGAFGGGVQGPAGGSGPIPSFSDAQLRHDFGDGVRAEASVGSYSGSHKYAVNAGFDPSTRTFTADGSYTGGHNLQNANVGFETPYGGYNAHLGSYRDGFDYRGNMSLGPDGLHATTERGRFGGSVLEDARVAYGQEGTYYNEIGLGRFSNATEFEGGSLDVTGDGVHAHLDQLRTGGFRMDDARLHNEILGVNTDVSVGHVSNDYLLRGADVQLGAAGHLGFEELDFGGVRVQNVQANSDLGGLGTAEAHLGSFGNGNSFKGAEVAWDENGLTMGLDSMGVAGMDIENAGWNVEAGPMHSRAQLDRLHTGFAMQGFNASLNGDGLHAHADNVTYDQMRVEGLNASSGIDGLYAQQLELGLGRYNSFAGDNINLGVDENGLALSGDNLAYTYLGLDDLHASTEYFDGALGQHLDLGRGSALGGTAEHLAFQSDGFRQSLSVDGLNAHGLQLEDVAIGANVGEANAEVGARRLDALDLDVGHLDTHSELFGTRGGLNVEDARLDLLQADDLHAGIGWGENELLGANLDFHSHLGIGNASADWDLWGGTARGRFENAQMGQQLSDASIRMGGYELGLPDMGYLLNATGGGDADLRRGAANANLNLSGSSLNFAGYEVGLGDWAQASAGVNLSQGAANFNLGGRDGIGADLNLAEGNFDIDAFGYRLDVDQGLRDTGSWVASTAGDAWDAAGDAVSFVGSLIPSISMPSLW